MWKKIEPNLPLIGVCLSVAGLAYAWRQPLMDWLKSPSQFQRSTAVNGSAPIPPLVLLRAVIRLSIIRAFLTLFRLLLVTSCLKTPARMLTQLAVLLLAPVVLLLTAPEVLTKLHRITT